MNALGLDLKWFLFQLGNFIIVLVALYYLLHKPLLNLIDSRKKEIEEGLLNAEKMKLALAESEARQKETLEQAQREAGILLKEAQSKARALSEQMQEEATAKAQSIIDKTSLEIQAEKEQMKTELKEELVSLVIKASETVLGSELPDTEKKDHIGKLLKEMD